MKNLLGTMFGSSALLLLAFATPPAASQPAVDGGPAEKESRGSLLYRVYCVNCHGESARGDGPTAKLLKVKPADLTRIAARNGGAFPKEEVRRKIDGREITPGHGKSRMPIWGLSFQELDVDTNQEEDVNARILALVDYLESIQDGE